MASSKYRYLAYLHSSPTSVLQRSSTPKPSRNRRRRVDHRLLASGSDDGRVKIWSTSQEGSVLELDLRANVCCAQYGPDDAHRLAVGCADHRVHLFDLRFPKLPVASLGGHRKAVSYARFLSAGEELVSASTDSTMRVWDVRAMVSSRAPSGPPASLAPSGVLEGHVNERNFVGLAAGANVLFEFFIVS